MKESWTLPLSIANKPILLVGMMGCGKSTLGKQLARRLHRKFIDVDAELERRSGASIRTIFEMEGESSFRSRETKLLSELLREDATVVATGGGAVCSETNRLLMHSLGFVVYLHATVDILFDRTKASKTRPLLDVADPRAKLMELYAARDQLYRSVAHVVVDAQGGAMLPVLQSVACSIGVTELRGKSIEASS